jgi:hypothetical protein
MEETTQASAYQKALLIKNLIASGFMSVVVKRKKGVTVTAKTGKNTLGSIEVTDVSEHFALSRAVELLDAGNLIDWYNCNLK